MKKRTEKTINRKRYDSDLIKKGISFNLDNKYVYIAGSSDTGFKHSDILSKVEDNKMYIENSISMKEKKGGGIKCLIHQMFDTIEELQESIIDEIRKADEENREIRSIILTPRAYLELSQNSLMFLPCESKLRTFMGIQVNIGNTRLFSALESNPSLLSYSICDSIWLKKEDKK